MRFIVTAHTRIDVEPNQFNESERDIVENKIRMELPPGWWIGKIETVEEVEKSDE